MIISGKNNSIQLSHKTSVKLCMETSFMKPYVYIQYYIYMYFYFLYIQYLIYIYIHIIYIVQICICISNTICKCHINTQYYNKIVISVMICYHSGTLREASFLTSGKSRSHTTRSACLMTICNTFQVTLLENMNKKLVTRTSRIPIQELLQSIIFPEP